MATPERSPEIEREIKIIHRAGAAVLSACMAPCSFILIANHQGPMVLAFVSFFSFTILAFYFQGKRMRLSRQVRPGPHKYQVGDEIFWPEKKQSFVVIKHGFNHYYLRPSTDPSPEKIYLVNRRKVELIRG